jgi:hypothetical protein
MSPVPEVNDPAQRIGLFHRLNLLAKEGKIVERYFIPDDLLGGCHIGEFKKFHYIFPIIFF